MIYTVTFNPSLDYYVTVPEFAMGRTNRTGNEHILPGGKGINVSILLKNLGIESRALGFCAGFTGEELVRMIKKAGITADFITLDSGFSRINVKLQNLEGTEFNASGPKISENHVEELYRKLDYLQKGDVLVLAGSIPASMPEDSYRVILQRLQGRGILPVVDASGTLLVRVLEYHPFLVKPNLHELEEIFQVTLSGRDSVVPWAKKLQEMGAANVLVSLAGDGAVLAAGDGTVYAADAPHGTLVNGVGAGDSMVAGFLAGWMRSGNYEEAFRMGVAAGSASAFSEHLADRKAILELYQTVCPLSERQGR